MLGEPLGLPVCGARVERVAGAGMVLGNRGETGRLAAVDSTGTHVEEPLRPCLRGDVEDPARAVDDAGNECVGIAIRCGAGVGRRVQDMGETPIWSREIPHVTPDEM